ncbi:helix-turn-helix domain-containing protein [Streptomyces sp. NPDC127112]|uniref:helix-turn-helix domain-containing protein n=1 Tax=Streptomyces sp. NPDC127112 TaxID=3345364 RepID=UPI003642617B
MTPDVETGSGSERGLPPPKERRRLRESGELTHEQVATELGVTPGTVRSWETGRTEPGARTRAAYADLLDRLARAGAGRPGGSTTHPGRAAKRAPKPPSTPPRHSPAHPERATQDPTAERPRPPLHTEAVPAHPAPAGPRATTANAAPPPPYPPHTPADTTPEPPEAAVAPHPAHTPAWATPDAPAPGHAAHDAPPPHTRAHTPAPTPPGHTSPAPTPPDHAPAGTTPPDQTAAGTTPPDHAPAGTAPETAPADRAVAMAAAPQAGAPGDGAAYAAPQAAPAAPARPTRPAEAFDCLYAYSAPALVRQVYLLTGRRTLAQESVERAFRQAWAQWPEVATDPDPVGWVRSAAYEYALSPWRRLRRAHRTLGRPDKAPADPHDRILLGALLSLPPAHRRTVLLYDGVGLDLPDTAAETEASTPTTGNRLLRAHADLAARLPGLAGVPPQEQSAVLRAWLGAVRPAVPLEPPPAATVRTLSEHRARRWARAALMLTAVIAAATGYTTVTAPDHYVAPVPAGVSVSGVPPLSGPPRLTETSRALQDRLREHPAAGPRRLHPSLE